MTKKTIRARAPQAARATPVTAEMLALKQRDISVSEFFLKNRHLLGFDSLRKALLTTVKEAVDNALDACEEAGIPPEISVEIQQVAPQRFRVAITDNGPGIVRAQIPKIFAKLLYGSKFHRLRMARGQQGIGISAAGMYAQLTTGVPIRILSRTGPHRKAHEIEVQMDTRRNAPVVLKDVESDWCPTFPPIPREGGDASAVAGGAGARYEHGTSVVLELEAVYARGRLSVDEYLRQCAVVNPHLQLHYRLVPLRKDETLQAHDGVESSGNAPDRSGEALGAGGFGLWQVFPRVGAELPPSPREIKPHPHGVELGRLVQMLKETSARTLKRMLCEDFCRVSLRVADEICQRAGLSPQGCPGRLPQRDVEALFAALSATRLMRPPTDCLSPIGAEALQAGLAREIPADFCTAVTRPPAVYRGNPFQIEVALAYARPGEADGAADEPVRVLRFANRVPLLHMAGACAITRAVTEVDWRRYGLAQPRGALPTGPAILAVHMASVWVPFTSESKEAIAHYPEILREITFGLQECGRRLAVFLSRRRRQAEQERKRNYMALYLPHLARGLREILGLGEREERAVVERLHRLLDRTPLQGQPTRQG